MPGAEKYSEKTLTAFSYERFLKAFEDLCGSKREKVILQDIYERMNDRWGYMGVDMVCSFPQMYKNLDFNRFQKVAEAFIYSSSRDLQEAIEEFWWLMGMGSHAEVLQDPENFHNLSAAMPERGLLACKALADGINEKIRESLK